MLDFKKIYLIKKHIAKFNKTGIAKFNKTGIAKFNKKGKEGKKSYNGHCCIRAKDNLFS